jgi:hypothetical protein
MAIVAIAWSLKAWFALHSVIGGAAAELFQAATGEATWDRGIAEVFSALLAAIRRCVSASISSLSMWSSSFSAAGSWFQLASRSSLRAAILRRIIRLDRSWRTSRRETDDSGPPLSPAVAQGGSVSDDSRPPDMPV